MKWLPCFEAPNQSKTSFLQQIVVFTLNSDRDTKKACFAKFIRALTLDILTKTCRNRFLKAEKRMFLTFKLIYDDMKVFKLQQTADAALNTIVLFLSKTFLLMLSWNRKIPFVVLKQNNKVIKGPQSILILFTMVIVISEDLNEKES